MTRTAGKIFAVLSFGLLAACGGGGGGSDTPSGPAGPAGPAPVPAPGGFTVEGRVLADPILVADTDTADPAQFQASNDSSASAQDIDDDTEVRGHVSCDPPSDTSLFCETGSDEDDFFEVALRAGQLISLSIADFSAERSSDTDLDLYLFDASGNLVSSSLEYASPVEQVTVPQTGRYFINVYAFEGGSNYALTITEPTSTTSAGNAVTLSRLSADQVTWVGGDAGRLMAGLSSLEREGAAGPDTDDGTRPDHMRVRREALERPRGGPLSAGYAQRTFGVAASAADPTYEAKLALLAEIKRINRKAGRTVVRPYHFPRMHFADPPPDSSLQWNLPATEWQQALTRVENEAPGAGRPLIAVLDSGVLTSHPKIQPVLVDQRDFVRAFIDGDGFDADAAEDTDPDDPNPDECFDYHGTHVATTATAPRAGGTIGGIEMVGALPFADLMMIKLGYNRDPQCQLIVGDVAAAIRYAARLPNSSGFLPARRADVINMSFGGPEPDAATRSAIEDAVEAGVIIVASAGNDGELTAPPPNYPAAYPEVIAVAATDIQDRRAYYSSFYPQVEVAAPGGDMRFDLNTDSFGDGILGGIGALNTAGTAFEARYGLYQGTSMAAPHVAAGFALMKAIYPELTSDDAHRLLEEGLLTDDLGTPGRDSETGFGLISYARMVDAALQLRDDALDLPADFRFVPTALDLGNIGVTARFEIVPSGDPDFAITDVVLTARDLDGTQLGVPRAIDVDASGFGIWEISIDRPAIPAGEYVAEVTVTAGNGARKILPVTFRIPPTSLSASTPPADVILERAVSTGFQRVQAQTVAEGAGGTFRFEGVTAGEYRLRFTTDMDNDGRVCDAGELGGTFPGRDCDGTETFSVPVSGDVAPVAVLRRLPGD